MSKRRSKKQSVSQRVLWFVSLFLVGSMVISLIIVALPSAPEPTPTLFPTFTPVPRPTSTPSPRPQPTDTVLPTPSPPPVATATERALGPEPATATITATQSMTYSIPSGSTPPPTDAPAPTATPAASTKPLTFAVCGDSRGNPAVYSRVLAAVAESGSQFLVHTGDLVDSGTDAQWLAFETMIAGFPLPFYPVPGNHDGLDGKLDGYLAHSGAPAPHYSFDRGGVHFTLADSHNGGISAAEHDWLRRDLDASSDVPVTMVFLHHPPFDPDGTDHIMAYGNQDFQELMVERGVDYVFAGHIHAYAQAERDGVVYTITGGAGAPLYAGDHPQAFHHYLLVTVEGEEVTLQVVRL